MIGAHEMKGGLLFGAAQRVVFLAMVTFSHWFTSLPRRSWDFFKAATTKQARRDIFLEKQNLAKLSLKGKRILMVDDDPGILEILQTELRNAYPNCWLDTAATYKEAATLMDSWTYDLVVLDITGAHGFDVLMQAVHRPYPVPAVMLNAEALPADSLKRALALGGGPCLPQERLRQIVSFLEGVMKLKHEPVWRRMLHPAHRRVSFPSRLTEARYSGAAAR